MVKVAHITVLRTCIVHWTSLVPVYLASSLMVNIVKQVILFNYIRYKAFINHCLPWEAIMGQLR